MFPTRIRILLVDDWDSIRQAISIGLELEVDAGYEVIGEASDGRQAILQCEDLQPDLVVMDVYMPRMDGIMATRQICQQFPHIIVIILTISMDTELAQEALNAGATRVITKETGIQNLKTVIQEHFH